MTKLYNKRADLKASGISGRDKMQTVVSDMKYLPRYSEFEVLKIKTDCSDINKLLN